VVYLKGQHATATLIQQFLLVVFIRHLGPLQTLPSSGKAPWASAYQGKQDREDTQHIRDYVNPRSQPSRDNKQTNKKLRGPQSASELYRLSDRHLSTKFSANFCG
jgi:hypothetical protein